jgi:hypothetical protein
VEEARFHEDALNLALLSDPASQFTSQQDLFWGLKRGLQVVDPIVCSTMLGRSFRVAQKEAIENKQQKVGASATVMGAERLLKVMLSMAAVRDRLQRRTDGKRSVSLFFLSFLFFFLLDKNKNMIQFQLFFFIFFVLSFFPFLIQ